MSTKTIWLVDQEPPDVVCFVHSASDDVVARFVDEAKAIKLRELVRDMHRCIANIGDNDNSHYSPIKLGCGMGCTVNGGGCCLYYFEDRMRDLGIEVGA